MLSRLPAQPHRQRGQHDSNAQDVNCRDPRDAPVGARRSAVDDCRGPGDVRRPVQPAPSAQTEPAAHHAGHRDQRHQIRAEHTEPEVDPPRRRREWDYGRNDIEVHEQHCGDYVSHEQRDGQQRRITVQMLKNEPWCAADRAAADDRNTKGHNDGEKYQVDSAGRAHHRPESVSRHRGAPCAALAATCVPGTTAAVEGSASWSKWPVRSRPAVVTVASNALVMRTARSERFLWATWPWVVM